MVIAYQMQQVQNFVDTCSIEQLKAIQDMCDDRSFKLGISKYCHSKVYGVYKKDNDELGYVGSTVQELVERWAGHRSFFNQSPNTVWSAYVFNGGGPDQFDIKLIENYPCRSRQELLEREGQLIKQLKPICNISMTALSADEKKVVSEQTKQLQKNEKQLLKCRTFDNVHDLGEKALIEKEWFLNHVACMCSDWEICKIIFNGMTDDTFCQKVINSICFQKEDSGAMSVQSLNNTYLEGKYKKFFVKATRYKHDMDTLIRELELSLNDSGIRIQQSVLIDKHEKLLSLVERLRGQLVSQSRDLI